MKSKLLCLTVIIAVFAFTSLSAQVVKPSKVVKAAHFDISKNLRDVEQIPPGFRARNWKNNIIDNKINFLEDFKRPSVLKGKDPALQDEVNASRSVATIDQNFGGATNLSGVAPPDTDGDVSDDYYVQMVNLSFAIYDKTGTLLVGPSDNQTFWEGFDDGEPFDNENDGDPIVLYDENADRWLVSQFAIDFGSNSFYELVAISQTNDPTGAWYRYAFQFDYMPDYPKFGIWSDGYYLSVNQFTSNSWIGGGVAILDRDAMIAGNADASMVFFNLGSSAGSLLPADCDGTWAPTDSPNYLLELETSSLRLWEAEIDWSNPDDATCTNMGTIAIDPYSHSNISINQPGTSQKLDDISDRLMNRLQYRNFGTHQSMVTNHTVNAGSGRAGVRWYELRNTGSGWSVFQQGTYAPADGDHRWMGSIAMNVDGDIALGYSVSGSSTYPSIRVTGQSSGAPDGLGLLDIAETTIKEGQNSQTGVSRWGDYARMSVDPIDDQTFWFTTEYTTGGWNWETQIASFILEDPIPQAPAADFNSSTTTSGINQMVAFNDQSLHQPTTWSWTFEGGDPATSTDQNPTVSWTELGTYDVSLTVTNELGSDTKTIADYMTISDITYCDSEGEDYSYEWTSQVDVGSFTNTSGASGYTDFTNLEIPLIPGASTSVTLTPDFSATIYHEYWTIWIDYNNNGDFSDAGEEVFTANGTTAVSGNFTVNADAMGSTRMRVSMKWLSASDPCEIFSYGEVEDYTVSFGSVPEADFSADETTISEGSSVQFTDLSTEDPTSWLWTFDGGTPGSSTLQNPSVVYSSQGTYSVSLEATNADGSDTETKDTYITVTGSGPQYCQVTGSEFEKVWTSSVELNGFTKNSVGHGYSNFTSDIIPLNETDNDLTLSVDFSGTTYRVFFRVWIDWNKDGDFLDSEELVFDPLNTKTSTSGMFNAKSGFNGTTRMRVGMQRTKWGKPLPCTDAIWGEFEDYTVSYGDADSPTADFSADQTNISEGGSINFTDQSLNLPTSWLWSFEGGNPSSSTDQNPVVSYATAGTYDVTLLATNSAGDDTKTVVDYVTVDADVSYCEVTGSYYDKDWISVVELNVFTKNSSGDGYSDFTADVIALDEFDNDITLTVDHSGVENRVFFRVWIDWNKDGDFSDSDELVYDPLNTKTSTSGMFDIVSGYSGSTRMRIGMQRTKWGKPESCTNIDHGEFEDYLVDYTAAAKPIVDTEAQIETAELSLYPNPVHDKLNVRFGNIKHFSVEVYNLKGERVITFSNAESSQLINVGHLPNGVYLIYGKTDSQETVKKFIKQ